MFSPRKQSAAPWGSENNLMDRRDKTFTAPLVPRLQSKVILKETEITTQNSRPVNLVWLVMLGLNVHGRNCILFRLMDIKPNKFHDAWENRQLGDVLMDRLLMCSMLFRGETDTILGPKVHKEGFPYSLYVVGLVQVPSLLIWLLSHSMWLAFCLEIALALNSGLGNSYVEEQKRIILPWGSHSWNLTIFLFV